MATTTPNYGWTVPTSTDLVKDGATAIETLGDAIDASMNTALGTKKAGMVLLNTTSFSAVSAASFAADTFTTTYNNYRIVFDATLTTNLFMRLRASGTDDTASNYVYVVIGLTEGNTADNASSGGAGNTFHVGKSASSLQCRLSIDLFSPKLTVVTAFLGQSMNRTNTSAMSNWDISGYLNTTTAYDALTLYPSTGTMTGTYSVYGYNK
jgi:hypothetical protein